MSTSRAGEEQADLSGLSRLYSSLRRDGVRVEFMKERSGRVQIGLLVSGRSFADAARIARVTCRNFGRWLDRLSGHAAPAAHVAAQLERRAA